MSGEPANKKFKKAKAKHYYKLQRKNILQAGYKGFLVTCREHEKDCVKECYNILNEIADELYGPEYPESANSMAPKAVKPKVDNADAANEEKEKAEDHEEGAENNADKKESDNDNEAESQEDEEDVADVLNNEIKAMGGGGGAGGKNGEKAKKVQRRFQQVDTGVQQCLFIRAAEYVDPLEVAAKLVDDVMASRKSQTRHLIRIIPVEVICSTNLSDMENTAGKLFDKHFLKTSSSYAILFKKRYNNSLRHEIVTHELAKLISSKNRNNFVNLKDPERSVVVEVIRGLCCMSVVKGYQQKKKYNLYELTKASDTGSDSKQQLDEGT